MSSLNWKRNLKYFSFWSGAYLDAHWIYPNEKVDLLAIRLVSVAVLGEMFATKGSNLFTTYEKTWSAWLER
jgi:hypothetical protein